ncbi:histone-like nucleoid-structuring protein Lsr2 [Cryptosporangium phraense]|uniref:Lsr2 family protein n=1 Tax=Cryptosporangium phraense TaxID=2593070 RepID=A0A545AGL0_9ACTN|nr:Lsr2 family protein [Cryptosporangium phraense]TQS40457.1 Lsr2 family protein [Cryptosporangium phraense]
MARKELVILTDDLDNSEIDPSSVDRATVNFGIDGVEYEIDLGSGNQAKLREILDEYVQAARRTGGTVRKGRKQATSTATSSSSRAENAAIREWAESNNIDVNSRGRLPNEVIERYRQHFSEQNDDAAEPSGRPTANTEQPAFSG